MSAPAVATTPAIATVVESIVKGVRPQNAMVLSRGWARKAEGAKAPVSRVVVQHRAMWIQAFYDRQLSVGKRANEYIAAKELKREFLDEDTMWLAPSALKSGFGKLAARRKVVEAQQSAQGGSGIEVAVQEGTARVGLVETEADVIASSSDVDALEELLMQAADAGLAVAPPEAEDPDELEERLQEANIEV